MSWDDWIRTVEVEPSLYAADFSRLGEQVEVLLRAECRVFHFDVGDGHFIPPVTIGPIVLKWIAPLVHREGGVLDVHLMVEGPERHIPQFAEAGADSVTVHFEACPNLPDVVALAREHGLQVGMAFNPETEVDEAAHAAREAAVDIALCMSVHPGYSGQAFIPESVERVAKLRSLLPRSIHVQVDGGVGPENIRALGDAGATLFVAGAAIFGREDLPRAYRRPAPGTGVSLERALELAERGRGSVEPTHPLVGAVLVSEGEVVGEGWYAGRGSPHAEVAALARRVGVRAGRRSSFRSSRARITGDAAVR